MNGNTLGDGVNAYTWDADNMLTSAGNGGSAAETYNYDADGERIMRVHNGVTTYYIGGVLEVDVQGGATVGWRVLYSFSGQLAEVRSSDGSNTFIFGDHLGSTEVASDPAGNAVSRQKFDPWGAVRPGSVITQTTVNYTGQRKDDTGLLYYHARYYDPSVARFMSADSIVPGSAGGAGSFGTVGQDSQAATRGLTVDFHEPGFVSALNGENAFTQEKGFYFQLSSHDRGQTKAPWGPGNPQALNRYSYTLNNPLRYTDPTGHVLYIAPGRDMITWTTFFQDLSSEASARSARWGAWLNWVPVNLMAQHYGVMAVMYTNIANHLSAAMQIAQAEGNADYGIAVELDGDHWNFMNTQTGEVYTSLRVDVPVELRLFDPHDWLLGPYLESFLPSATTNPMVYLTEHMSNSMPYVLIHGKSQCASAC